LIKDLGHEITPLAPSLFTFKCSHPIINGLPGTSLQSASLTLEVEGKKFKQIGPILITHWGFSGPAVLKLSAFAARELKKSAYKATLKINWCDQLSEEEIYQKLKKEKSLNSKKQAHNSKLFNFSKRFWERICELNKLKQKSWGETSDKDLRKLSHFLNQERYKVAGKGEFKDEFVTCGGVSLKEINLNSFESKIHPGLYFAGEVLDVDGITGGFNFQNAWSSSYQVAKAVTKSN
ncbi:MAG: aminoacetone oxidase family FAD-binding enzyme, partial [Bacteriovoracaceae bacterium]